MSLPIIFSLLCVLIVGILALYKGIEERSVMGVILGVVFMYFPITLIPDFLPGGDKNEEVVSATEIEKDKSTVLKNLHIVESSLNDKELDKKEVKEILRAGELLDISVEKEIEAYIDEPTVLTQSKLELKLDKIVNALGD